ncbi:MAG: hypothetical protein U0790_27350 [Isosphaeraceae bacterium]
MHGLPKYRRTGILCAFLLPASFLTANLLTGDRSPVVWQDEVMFADPAVNLWQGRGFTTTAWFQSGGLPFAGNSPLYSLCLCPWIGVFGLSVTAVRALNYVLLLATVAIGLAALGRLGLVRSTRARVLLAVLVSCGDGVAFCYRSGRYDCLGMVVVASLALGLTIRRPRPRAAVLLLATALVPWAGLQLALYLAILGLLLLAVRGRDALADLSWVAAGMALGLGSLAAYLLGNGVWGEFSKSVAIVAGARSTIPARLAAALWAPLAEPSSPLLLATLGLALVAAWRRGAVLARSPLVLGVAIGIGVPFLLGLAGKYPRYYGWMAFMPMAACMAVQIEQGSGRRLGPVAALLLVLTCLVGLPARLAVTCLEWRLRDPRPVDEVVSAAVRPTDRVYADYEAYYPAKRAAATVFLPPYAGLMPEMEGTGISPALSRDERAAVDVLIVKPSNRERTLRHFGGRWSRVAHYSAEERVGSSSPVPLLGGSRPYDLVIYRRLPDRGALAARRG